MSERATIEKIRVILQDSDLTIVDSDCSVERNWRNEEIDYVMYKIAKVLDDEVLSYIENEKKE